MKEVFLQKKDGWLRPVNDEGEEALESFPDNQILRVKITQPRSLPHHAFFFAFLNEVFKEWPATHKIQPSDPDMLRQWLLVKAGIKESRFISWKGMGLDNPFMLISVMKNAAIMLTSRPVWFAIDPDGGMIEIMAAKSIAFANMDEQDFKETTARVFDVVYVEAGIDVDEYYSQWQKKNGKLKIEPSKSINGL